MTWFKNPSRRLLALGSALVTVGASAGGTLAATSGSTPHRPHSVHSRAQMAESTPSELASAFSSFKRAAGPEDALPMGAVSTINGSVNAGYGLNPSLSRLLGEAGGSKIWLVPGSTGSCLYDALSGGAICASNSAVRSQGLTLLLVPVSGAQPTLVGAVPDGSTVTAKDRSGSATGIPVPDSVFRVSGYGGGDLTIQTPSGTQVVPIPTPAPAPSGPASSATSANAQPPTP